MENIDLESILESMILISSEPLSVFKMHETLQSCDVNVSTKEIESALNKLVKIWQEEKSYGRGLILKEIGDGYLFTTNPKNALFIKKLIEEKPINLSKAQSEVLAIVAFKQPVTRFDIDDIRGVDSSFAIKKLLQYNLLKILGKSEGLGRPLLYGTTKYFLEFFSLTSLKDLPTLTQYESLGSDDKEVETNENVVLKDLFLENKPMFSKKVEELSVDALKSLDEALLNLNTFNIKPNED